MNIFLGKFPSSRVSGKSICYHPASPSLFYAPPTPTHTHEADLSLTLGTYFADLFMTGSSFRSLFKYSYLREGFCDMAAQSGL